MRGANCPVAPTLYDPENDSLCAMLNFKNQNDPIKRGSNLAIVLFLVHREKRDRPPRSRTHNKFFVVDYYY